MRRSKEADCTILIEAGKLTNQAWYCLTKNILEVLSITLGNELILLKLYASGEIKEVT
jgi:hypothetical protein